MSWGSRRYALPPQLFPLDYAVHLPTYTADVLKQMARVWVGKDASKLNKDACTKAIINGLANPTAVRAVIDGLSPFERAGLGLLKHHGQIARTDEFAVELFMLGYPTPPLERAYSYGFNRSASLLYGGLNTLIKKGLVLGREWDQGYGSTHDAAMGEYYYRPEVFSDHRLLTHMETTPPVTLSLTPFVAGDASGMALQPAEVVLRLVSMVETLRKLGRIDITTKGRLAKPFVAKLTKALGWEEAAGKSANAPFPQVTSFFFQLLQSAGCLQSRPELNSLEVSPQANALFEKPYSAQATAWVNGYRSLTHWTEYTPSALYFEDDDPSAHRKFTVMRSALLMALAALPDATAWYRLSDISDAIYERIGEYFSLLYFQGFYPAYGRKVADEAKQRAEWRKKNRERWQLAEQTWILHAMVGPLYHLGLVALARESNEPTPASIVFRLTPLGRAVLYDPFRPASASTTVDLPTMGPDGPCWIVQPNFDVVVYLDRASAAQLAFVERIAARKPSSGATVLYHLTRETVYAALESGITPDILIERLSRGCDYPLPENIKQTLADWAARREQLSVYRSVDVLEFPTQEERDAALAKRPGSGTAVGERYILLSREPQSKTLAAHAQRVVSYIAPPARCLSVTEDGTFTIAPARTDLLVAGELSAWAETDATSNGHWRITRQSVQKAMSAGWTVESMLENLKHRLQHDLPPLLFVAIRAWAGVRTLPTTVAVATDLILQVTDLEVARAIGGSALLQPYFRGRLGRQTFLVKHESVEEFRSRLAELGLQVGNDVALLGPGWKD
ncbi:MAG: hypothetical protein FJ147_22350 [Deltaproteobacteria bacterium]|nr:hypothetical protein [Deltaproteobacteria bacterium]